MNVTAPKSEHFILFYEVKEVSLLIANQQFGFIFFQFLDVGQHKSL